MPDKKCVKRFHGAITHVTPAAQLSESQLAKLRRHLNVGDHVSKADFIATKFPIYICDATKQPELCSEQGRVRVNIKKGGRVTPIWVAARFLDPVLKTTEAVNQPQEKLAA